MSGLVWYPLPSFSLVSSPGRATFSPGSHCGSQWGEALPTFHVIPSCPFLSCWVGSLTLLGLSLTLPHFDASQGLKDRMGWVQVSTGVPTVVSDQLR